MKRKIKIDLCGCILTEDTAVEEVTIYNMERCPDHDTEALKAKLDEAERLLMEALNTNSLSFMLSHKVGYYLDPEKHCDCEFCKEDK